MTFTEKKKQLSQIIEDRLLPVINKNGAVGECVYLGLPYYTNIGDTLIWEGTEHFLRRTGLKCLYKAANSTYSECAMKKITRRRNNPPCKKILIFLQGGGNFGDLWVSHHNFRKEIIKNYPDNPIIILSQTVFYSDESKMKTDAELFANYKNLTICARDNKSYQILKNNFKNDIILVPDMAFCIPDYKTRKYLLKQNNNYLFLKRRDKELNTSIDYSKYIRESEFNTHDWPSIEKTILSYFLLKCFLWINRRLPFFNRIIDIYASILFKPDLIKIGVNFLSKYEKVCTTRLHGAILCCLLEKPCVFFDNSYGKNSAFFETWLSDLDDIMFISAINV